MTAFGADDRVSIAGNVIDPLVEQGRQREGNRTVPATNVAAWLVQFVNSLTALDIADCRSRFGLRLTDYVPPRGYVEALQPGVAERLQADPRIRAVMRLGSDQKLPAAVRAELEDNEPADPAPFDIVVFDSAVDTVLAQVNEMVAAADLIAVLDDRSRGGAFVLRVRGGSRLAATAASLDGVRWVQPVPEMVDDEADGCRVVGSSQAAARRRADIDAALGLSGTGQIVGIIDNGPLDLGHSFFRDPANPTPGDVHRKVVAIRNVTQTSPGKHATFTSCIAVGDDLAQPGTNPDRGVAWGARVVSGNRGDLKQSSMLSEFAAAAESGAFVHSNSWHSAPQGFCKPATYGQGSADVDAFCWLNEDHVIVGSSGNTGEEQGEPGTAKNALCVSAAAVGSGDEVGDGCNGPTADGRRKPDLMGVGCGVVSALIGTGNGIGPSAKCASSYAAPWVAGILVLVRQQLMEGRYRDGKTNTADGFVPTGALLRAVAISAAVASGQDVQAPSVARGWGLMDAAAAVGQKTPRLLVQARNSEGLAAGGSAVVDFDTEREGWLTVTLVWTEPPGAVGSDRCAVNHLDLAVATPTGDVYSGNRFVDGVSVVGQAVDTENNVQVVLLQAKAGRWKARITAVDVNVGPTQGFALVVCGAISDAAVATMTPPLIVRKTIPVLRKA
ncbi:S8 family serine peptidase [Mycobacterium yunnanensis]|uniref:S8 family serine peptidase n=1 Tax=Mycobacterium yunnanensis TaxID=368477 RepID=A0A9X3C4A4_9MYCO|nr:S8 family serine peptidase [Mycobacterium yunnanensis]MCV7423337.1 S8 family serine peptidase [Mycobacterium yunnanensis]